MVDWVLHCTGKLEVGILLWSRFPALCRWLWRICISSAVLGWMWYIFHLSSLTHEDKHRCTLDFVCCAGRINLRCTPELKKMAGHSLTWVLSAAVFATLYGLSDEIHQSFVSGRSASALDVMWDGTGALAAAIILGYLISNWTKLWGTLSQAAHLR